ncbi:MAG: hypothetical protein ACRD0V_09155 [Acidimicrobiales bacterium]
MGFGGWSRNTPGRRWAEEIETAEHAARVADRCARLWDKLGADRCARRHRDRAADLRGMAARMRTCPLAPDRGTNGRTAKTIVTPAQLEQLRAPGRVTPR